MDKPGRLPSFKPPRDLTLSRGDGTARTNRRTYAPNIPQPRVARGASSSYDTSNNVPSPGIVGPSTSVINEPSSSRNASGFSDGGRKHKKRGELVQSESIFSQGVGDPTLARRKLANTPTSLGIRSTTKGAGGRKGYMGKSQLSDILKKKEQEEENENQGEDWLGGNFIEYSDDEEEDSINHVSIPLSSYLYEDRVKKPDQTLIKKSETPAPKLPTNSFANLFYSTDPREDKLLLLQLPNRLPVLDKAAAEASQNSKDNIQPTLESLAESIDSLPEGPIGKIQLMASGKCKFVMGENIFDVQPGANISFLQALASINLEDKKLVNLGPVTNKFILTPNIELLLNQS